MKRVLIDIAGDLTRTALVEDSKLIEVYYESKRQQSLVGNIYVGRIEQVVANLQACFVEFGEEKKGFLYYGQERATSDEQKISKKPKAGDTVLVQVVKDATGQKGATLSTNLSLTGKFMVLLPMEAGELRVSRKITDEKERNRIRRVLGEILPEGFGAIVRTNGSGREQEDFAKELALLLKKEEKLARAEFIKPPMLLLEDSAPALKAARDFYSDRLDELVVNQKEAYDSLLDSDDFNKEGAPKLILHEDKHPLFESYLIESQCSKALEKRVWLKSGGYLVIEQTEACAVVDVNSAKAAGKGDLQRNMLKTNLEAAAEVAKQIRLRNLSGIIIVDFIDMPDDDDKLAVTKALEEVVKKDRIKTVVVGMTQLGLMQITRKRTRPSLQEQMTTKCRQCEGHGRVPSIDWTVVKMRREVEGILANTIYNYITVEGNEKLLYAFAGGVNRDYIKQLEQIYDGEVICVGREDMAFAQYSIQTQKNKI